MNGGGGGSERSSRLSRDDDVTGQMFVSTDEVTELPTCRCRLVAAVTVNESCSVQVQNMASLAWKSNWDQTDVVAGYLLHTHRRRKKADNDLKEKQEVREERSRNFNNKHNSSLTVNLSSSFLSSLA